MDLSYRIGRICCKICSFLFFPVKVHGVQNLPKDGTFILAANHVSNLDPFLIGTFCGRILNFVAKEELFKSKLLGVWISSLGAFPIRRDSADFRGMRETLRRLKKYPVLIFPEGTRKIVDGTKKIQQGIGFIAVKAKLPVYPVLIEGSEKVLPPGGRFPRRKTVTITVGQPVEIPPSKDYSTIASQIVEKIYELKKT